VGGYIEDVTNMISEAVFWVKLLELGSTATGH
jgi:hypothetical protein